MSLVEFLELFHLAAIGSSRFRAIQKCWYNNGLVNTYFGLQLKIMVVENTLAQLVDSCCDETNPVIYFGIERDITRHTTTKIRKV